VDFKAATDRMTGQVTHADLAGELGVSLPSIRQARLGSDAEGYRSPPPGWQSAVASLARKRAQELLERAEELEG